MEGERASDWRGQSTTETGKRMRNGAERERDRVKESERGRNMEQETKAEREESNGERERETDPVHILCTERNRERGDTERQRHRGK